MNTSNQKQPLLAIVSASVFAGVLLLGFALFYGDWTQFFKDTDYEFKSSLPYVYVAIIGISVTVATIVATVPASQRNRLKQDTIKILFEMRDVIMYFRKDQGEKRFEHLISIYWQWVEKGKQGEHDSSMGEDDDYFDPLKPEQGRNKGRNTSKKKSKLGVRAKNLKR